MLLYDIIIPSLLRNAKHLSIPKLSNLPILPSWSFPGLVWCPGVHYSNYPLLFLLPTITGSTHYSSSLGSVPPAISNNQLLLCWGNLVLRHWPWLQTCRRSKILWEWIFPFISHQKLWGGFIILDILTLYCVPTLQSRADNSLCSIFRNYACLVDGTAFQSALTKDNLDSNFSLAHQWHCLVKN